MGGFFLFILIIFFVISLLGGAFLRSIFRFLLKKTTSSFATNFERQTYGNNQQNKSDRQSYTSQYDSYRREHKKVFSRNEGEYVDFEEIK